MAGSRFLKVKYENNQEGSENDGLHQRALSHEVAMWLDGSWWLSAARQASPAFCIRNSNGAK
jgi:hypothetical protein